MRPCTSSLSVLSLCLLAACGGDDGSSPAPEPRDAATTARSDAGVRTDASTPSGGGKDAGKHDAGKPPSSIPPITQKPTKVTDCNEATRPFCIAGEGTVDGKAVSCEVDDESAVSGGGRWTISCSSSGDGASMQLEIPVQDPGALDLSATPADLMGMTFYVLAASSDPTATGSAMTEASGNLISARVMGTVEAGTMLNGSTQTSGNTLTGTLIASWSKPDTPCEQGPFEASQACAEGSVLLTFHVVAP